MLRNHAKISQLDSCPIQRFRTLFLFIEHYFCILNKRLRKVGLKTNIFAKVLACEPCIVDVTGSSSHPDITENPYLNLHSTVFVYSIFTCMVRPSFLIRSLPSLVHGAGSSSSRFSRYLQTKKPDLPFAGQYFTTWKKPMTWTKTTQII